MAGWCRRLTGGVLAAIALVVLNPQPARADPAVPATPSGLSPQISTGGSAEADRDFLVRVRLARLYPELGGSGLSRADRDFLIKVRLASLAA